jgi:signal transduction histidine kinase
MTGMALALALILAFLYVRTQDGAASSYFLNVATLRQLKQLDAQWELDILRAKMGIETSYDSLVEPVGALNLLWGQLRTDMAAQQRTGAGQLGSLGAVFQQAIAQKTRLVEHFKSHNAVLRNSLAFLPTAADDLEQALPRDARNDGASKEFAAQVNRMLLDSIVFSQTPTDDKSSDIQAQLKRLSRSLTNPSAAVRQDLEILVAHVRTVLREQPQVNELLSGIAAVPTAASMDAIDNALSLEQRAYGLRAQQYRRYMLMFAAALAGLFLYAAVSLVRSGAVIHRVNSQLQAANATLEARVRERTRELHEAQSELMTTARQVGMAEIAKNVLHNVGNVLNSVNVSAGLIASRLRESKVRGLAKAVQLLNEHAADLGDFLDRSEQGKVLPSYLNNLVTALAAERASIDMELASLIGSVDHIKEIVATQQSYSGASCLIESVQIQDLVEDALRMNADSKTSQQISVVKEFADAPPLLLDKHLVLQILINLISNARNAMDGVRDRLHRMTLRTELAESAEGPRLRIRIEDDGEGIAAENLARLFTHGFTTRQRGHGFGLHSCALAAKEMKGTIRAHSDGPGKGATFTLELPARIAG